MHELHFNRTNKKEVTNIIRKYYKPLKLNQNQSDPTEQNKKITLIMPKTTSPEQTPVSNVKKSGNWGLDEIDCHCSHEGQCT